jgi:SAM-dependent methyltransferase
VAAFDPGAVRRTYDIVADDYATKFGDDLDQLPFDREVLDQVGNRRPVLDLGCGPGQVGEYMGGRGTDVVGIDISPGMLAVARRRSPQTPVVAADIRRLPLASGSCAAAVAFYCLQYLPRSTIGAALAEIRRALQPDGVFIFSMHLGTGTVQTDTEWMGHAVESVGATFYEAGELEPLVVSAGFRVDSSRQRGPLPHEHQGDRVYITAVTSPPSPRSRP